MLNSYSAEKFIELEKLIKGYIFILDEEKIELTAEKIRKNLEAANNCFVVTTLDNDYGKIGFLMKLHRKKVAFKKLQHQLCRDYPCLKTSLIGIYPSLDYPACIYEMSTNADRYVKNNVLPYDRNPLKRVVKYLLIKLLGINPVVGGIGLSVHKE